MHEYLWVVQLDIPVALDPEFNLIYDTQHIPNIRGVPGVLGVQRYCLKSPVEGVARYMTTYRVTSPDLPFTADWIAASSAGDWPTCIRPHVRNVTRAMYQTLSGPSGDS